MEVCKLKKFTSKLIATILSIAMIVAVVVPVSAAAGVTIAPANAIASTGDEQVTVPVSISGNTGFNSARINLAYDSALTLVECTGGDFDLDISVAEGDKVVILDYQEEADITADGVLFNLVFDASVLTAGTYEVTTSVNSGDCVKYDETPVAVTGGTATVTVSQVESILTVADGEVEPGESVSLEVSLSYNPGIYAALFDVDAPEGFTLTDVTSDVFEAEVGEHVLLTSSSASNVKATGVIATLVFDVADTVLSGEYDVTLTYNEGDIINIAEQDVSVTVVAGTVSVTGCDHTCEWVTVKDATCKEEGLKKYICSKCHTEFDSQVIPVSNVHTWGKWVVITPATATTEGSKQRTCSVCGKVENAVIPVAVQDGWATDENGDKHYYVDGKESSGFVDIDGLTYYFYPETGILNTETRIKIGANYYNFFGANAKVKGVDKSYSYKVGWVLDVGGIRRYYPEGSYWFLTGFQAVGDNRYFFDSKSGALYVPSGNGLDGFGWVLQGGVYYALDPADGKYVVGFVEDKNGNTVHLIKYSAKAGVSKGILTMSDGSVYYCDATTGVILKNGVKDFAAGVKVTKVGTNGQLVSSYTTTALNAYATITFGESGKATLIQGLFDSYYYMEDGNKVTVTDFYTHKDKTFRVKNTGKVDTYYYCAPGGRYYYLCSGEWLNKGIHYIEGASNLTNLNVTGGAGYYYVMEDSYKTNTKPAFGKGLYTHNGLEYYFNINTGKMFRTYSYGTCYRQENPTKGVVMNFYYNTKGTYVIDGVELIYSHKVGLCPELDGNNVVYRYYKDGTAGCLKNQTVTVDGVKYQLDAKGNATAIG